MKEVKNLIIGSGISGVSFAHYIDSEDYIILEKQDKIGGKLKTIKQDGFIWDYAGHFLHFDSPEIQSHIKSLLDCSLLEIEKHTHIYYDDDLIDYPFQKNIHQLPKDEFIDCLYDVYFSPEEDPETFKKMLESKFGKSICEKFLFPYNEKLYACDLNKLDKDAMGRFFPYADFDEILENIKQKKDDSYNSSFIYPEDGIYSLVEAYLSDVSQDKIRLNTEVTSIDVKNKIAYTPNEKYSYESLISTIPLTELIELVSIDFSTRELDHNKVLVFNMGFNSPSELDSDWIYYPNKAYNFHRVGFYDNILNQERMSIYVEIGFPADANVDLNAQREKTLSGLEEVGILNSEEPVSEHSVIMDPAYCYISEESEKHVDNIESHLESNNIYLSGRFAQWIYCSIEDNIVRAKKLAEDLSES